MELKSGGEVVERFSTVTPFLIPFFRLYMYKITEERIKLSQQCPFTLIKTNPPATMHPLPQPLSLESSQHVRGPSPLVETEPEPTLLLQSITL